MDWTDARSSVTHQVYDDDDCGGGCGDEYDDEDGDDDGYGYLGSLDWTDARSSVTHQVYDRCYHLIAGVDVAIS